MQDTPDDEFNGIFENATVADFERTTSARSEIPSLNLGPAAFHDFVEEQLRSVRTAWIASETHMQPYTIIANHDTQRIFTPEDDETLGQYVARMHREAQNMGAHWTFIAKRSMVANVGPVLEAENDVDVSDPHEFQKAVEAGLVRLGVLWYAERREGNERQKRHGQIQDEDGVLGELYEGAANQGLPLFDKILAD